MWLRMIYHVNAMWGGAWLQHGATLLMPTDAAASGSWKAQSQGSVATPCCTELPQLNTQANVNLTCCCVAANSCALCVLMHAGSRGG